MALAHNFLVFYILILQVFSFITNTCSDEDLPSFSAIFLFGDSFLDSGNNNYINTICKANHFPYGQAFPGHVPTGRFSDGKLISDFLASALKIKETVPPFLDPNLSNEELKTGASFASTGAGYDDLTGSFEGVIPLSTQLQNFNNYIEKIKRNYVEKESNRTIQDSLTLVFAGSNDITMNFFEIPMGRFQFTIDQYHGFLLKRTQGFLKTLYEIGCRNMMVAGLPPLGCRPVQLNMNLNGKCLDKDDSEVQAYNEKLVKALREVEETLPESNIVYTDLYKPMKDMIRNPQEYGFVVTNRGCCGIGMVEMGPLCNTISMCPNASQFLYWDAANLGEAANSHISQYFMDNLIPQFLLS